MTPNRFELLCALERAPAGLSAQEAAGQAGLPLSLARYELTDLDSEQLVFSPEKGLWHISQRGLQALSPYRVRRAVILAAGFGSRLNPLTNRIPKPMIPVNGVRMIDTLLDALYVAEIPEVHLIRGHLGEAFDALVEKYPRLQLTDNPLFASSNNLSSALYAKEWLQNAYICDADLLLLNPRIIRKYELRTNYLGCWCEHTDDWRFHLDGEFIEGASVGGDNCCRMFGLSYWTEADGRRLAEDIVQTAGTSWGREHFWDEVPLTLCKKHYRIALRVCGPKDILEIDTLEELAALDASYRPLLGQASPALR